MRIAAPIAALFRPMAFFLSVLSREATKANRLVNLADVGATLLTVGLIALASD